MEQNKAAALVGLAMKAGKIAGGEFAAERAVKSLEAKLLILSEDASANTVKKFGNMAAYRKIPVCRMLDKESLGRAVGKGERSCLAVTDEGFARHIAQMAAAAGQSSGTKTADR